MRINCLFREESIRLNRDKGSIRIYYLLLINNLIFNLSFINNISLIPIIKLCEFRSCRVIFIESPY